jgi:Beta-ketoacyl synthase, N-terminal domain
MTKCASVSAFRVLLAKESDQGEMCCLHLAHSFSRSIVAHHHRQKSMEGIGRTCNGGSLFMFGSIRVVEILGNHSTTNTKEEEVSMSTQTTQSDNLLIDPTQSGLKEDVGKAGGTKPIAIIGIGYRFPGVSGPGALLELLCNGVDAITKSLRTVSTSTLSMIHVRARRKR